MPYYCTVPRCTSMAGKNKNVSFHQFPRDEELAKLWNKILKRGKPYTKYSKVCSLHFTSEDYTVTSGQKNKGSWRTLRKNAIPSRNLPTDWPNLNPSQGSSQTPPPVLDPRMHQQMAQAIYVQTMLAMQAASIISIANPESSNSDCDSSSGRSETSSPTNGNEQAVNQDAENVETALIPKNVTVANKTTYKCIQCSKCFKDPDVFILHQRTHSRNIEERNQTQQNTLLANPILANLLGRPESSKTNTGVFNVNNVNSIENQIMMALAANMENYLQNLDSIMTPLSLIETGRASSILADCSETKETDNRMKFQNTTDIIDNEENHVEDNKSIDTDSDETQMVIDENNETQLTDTADKANETMDEEEHSNMNINNVDKCHNSPLEQEEYELTDNHDFYENKENHEDIDKDDCEISINKVTDKRDCKSINGISNNYQENTLIGN